MSDGVGLGLSNVGVGGWVVVGVEIGWWSSSNHLNLLRGSKSCGFGGSISCGELRLGSSNF